jgi:glycosyltransferase involved in cell wall biosynthesis
MAEQAFPKTLVIIPALNEEDSIARVVRDIRQQLPHADVMVVNDGSTDDTGRIAAQAGALVLHLPYNVGIGAAVQTGFMFAEQQGYEVVIRSDGDGQHDPSELRRLLDALQVGDADMIIGSRYIEDRGYTTSTPRRMGTEVLARLISAIIGQPITDPTSGFNAFNQRTIQLCAKLYPHDYPEPEALVILHRAGLRLREIPVTMKPRAGGRSSITPFRSIYYMFKVTLAILIGLLRRAPMVNGEV